MGHARRASTQRMPHSSRCIRSRYRPGHYPVNAKRLSQYFKDAINNRKSGPWRFGVPEEATLSLHDVITVKTEDDKEDWVGIISDIRYWHPRTARRACSGLRWRDPADAFTMFLVEWLQPYSPDNRRPRKVKANPRRVKAQYWTRWKALTNRQGLQRSIIMDEMVTGKLTVTNGAIDRAANPLVIAVGGYEHHYRAIAGRDLEESHPNDQYGSPMRRYAPDDTILPDIEKFEAQHGPLPPTPQSPKPPSEPGRDDDVEGEVSNAEEAEADEAIEISSDNDDSDDNNDSNHEGGDEAQAQQDEDPSPKHSSGEHAKAPPAGGSAISAFLSGEPAEHKRAESAPAPKLRAASRPRTGSGKGHARPSAKGTRDKLRRAMQRRRSPAVRVKKSRSI